MNKLFVGLALFAALLVAAVWLQSLLQARTWRKRWAACLKQAGEIVAGIKRQYPGCEDCRMAGVTVATDLQQASSAYKNISFEDFQDEIDAIDPAQCPMMAMTPNEMALGSTEWSKNVDSYDAAKGARGVSDNQPVVSGDVTNHTSNIRKVGNIAQAFREVIGVGWIAQNIPRVAGVKDLMARAKVKAAVLLKVQQEQAMCSLDQTAVADGGTSLGAIGAGYLKLVVSANAYASVTAFAYGKATDLHSAPASAVVTGVLSATHSRAMWKTVSKALRVAAKMGGDWTLLCGLDLRQAITDLTNPTPVVTAASAGAVAQSHEQVRVMLRNEQDATLGATVDVIQTDFGRFIVKETDYVGYTTVDPSGNALSAWATNSAQRITASFSANLKAGLIIKRGNVYKRWGIPTFSTPIAPDGGSDRLDTKNLVGFGVKNPILAGVINFSA